VDALVSGVESIRVMHPLFQVGQGGSIPTSTLQLRFAVTRREVFKKLNRLWHSRLPECQDGHRVYYSASYEGIYYAVAMWTNPSAPKLPQLEWIELKRLAIADDAPHNTASRFLGWMARDISKRFPIVTTLVSYRDCDVHSGTIYKAAGWTGGPEQVRSPNTTWKNRPRARSLNKVVPRRVQRWTKQVG
jgi:hypothetical protein